MEVKKKAKVTKYNSMEFSFIQDSGCLHFSIICRQSLAKKMLVLNNKATVCFGDGCFMELLGKFISTLTTPGSSLICRDRRERLG